MPRKRPADRAGPVKTRNHGGCKECRASRVRCDTKKPVCSRCWERGLPCSTQLVLKWESEYTSRGLAFGRAGVWNKSGGQLEKSSLSSHTRDEQSWCDLPTIRPWGFVNSGVLTFERPHQVDIVNISAAGLLDLSTSTVDDEALSPMSVPERVPEPPMSLSLFPDVSQSSQGHLFEYYFQQVCPRTSASSTLSSPFASVILPFCLSASPTLFKAIQALGACHWSRFDSSHSAVSLRFKSETLRDLRRRLTVRGPVACSVDSELLVIMMMLCLYEIVDNCDQHWTIHLKGAKELIKIRRQQPALPSQDSVSAFAERFFAFQDVMGRTACGEEVLFGGDYWQEGDRSVDSWMGCSHELASILSSITELSRSRTSISDSSRPSFFERAASLEHNLNHLVQKTDGDDQTLRSVAELKRLAAILYLQCALYGASPSTPLVIGYVRKILSMVSDLLECASLVSVTWPVFVAAVELDPLNDELWSDANGEGVHGRPLVLRALAAMAESTVSNVARTRAVIVKVWQSRDVDMLKGSAEARDPTTCNDWEWYIAPISSAMSLA